jgi:hypothetical protein
MRTPEQKIAKEIPKHRKPPLAKNVKKRMRKHGLKNGDYGRVVRPHRSGVDGLKVK